MLALIVAMRRAAAVLRYILNLSSKRQMESARYGSSNMIR